MERSSTGSEQMDRNSPRTPILLAAYDGAIGASMYATIDETRIRALSQDRMQSSDRDAWIRLAFEAKVAHREPGRVVGTLEVDIDVRRIGLGRGSMPSRLTGSLNQVEQTARLDAHTGEGDDDVEDAEW